MNPRGILYVRRSRAKQEASLSQQCAWAVQRAASEGIDLRVRVGDEMRAVDDEASVAGDLYLDNAITGADMNRPGFLAFIDRAIHDKEITHVFFWKRDRFARPDEAWEAVALEKKIRCAGKHVITSDGSSPPISDPRDCMGEDVMMLLGYAEAGRFRPDLARKVLRAQAANAKRGYSPGRRAPYGFGRFLTPTDGGEVVRQLDPGETTSREGHKIVLLPGKSPEDKRKLKIVRRIAEEYHAGLGGLGAIARRLNADGVPSPDAGRRRNGQIVSGRWTISSVREIIEQPLYAGLVSWGRHSEGTVYRFDPTNPENARRLTEIEAKPDGGSGLARKMAKRDVADWVLVKSPVPFKPIVSEETWAENFHKLKERGSKGQGRRGVPRHSDPNKYPLQVICGMCGEPMQGSRKYREKPSSIFVCSSYMNGNGRQCAHNWIERDQVVAFVVNATRERLSVNGRRDTLRDAIRETLKGGVDRKKNPQSEITKLEARAAQLDRQRTQAYRDMIGADDARRSDAETVYEEIRRESSTVRDRLRELKARAEQVPADPDAQVTAALDVLSRLHLFLGRVPDSLLRQTFEALGVRLTIDFARTKEGRRRTIPVGGKLEFGVNGRVSLSGLLSGQGNGADESGAGSSKGAIVPFGEKEKAEAGKAEKETPNTRSIDRGERMLGVSGRGGPRSHFLNEISAQQLLWAAIVRSFRFDREAFQAGAGA